MIHEIIDEFAGSNRAEKLSFRAIWIGTFAVSQLDSSMRGAGTVAFGAVCAAGAALTFIHESQPVTPVQQPEAPQNLLD
jgi:hypothetical protein